MRQYGKAAMILLTISMIPAMLSGCAGKTDGNMNMVIADDSSDRDLQSININFFGYKVDAINLVAIEDALHDFMDIHPDITITYEGLKGQTYWDAFEKRNASGNLDDIFNIDHDHLMSLYSEGKLADLSGLSTIDNYNALARSQFTMEDGSVYFLPISVATYGLYVNLDMLKQHGLETPEDLSEFTQVCDYFTDRGITPIIINNFNAFRSLVVAKSLYPIYQKENPAAEIHKFNTGEESLADALRPGVELAAFMLEKDWIDCEEALITDQTSDDLAIFAKGNRPFMISGGWASPRVAALNPEFSYAIYPLPVLDDSSVLVMEMATCISINADSPHLDEAQQFVEFLTQTDVMWEYCDSQSSLTPLNDDRQPSDPTIEPSMPGSVNGEMVMGSDFNLDLPLDSALRECGMRMMQGMDVDSAIAFLKEQLVAPQ